MAKPHQAASSKTGPAKDTAADTAKRPQRPRLSQEDVPSYPLGQALRVPSAIAESYAYKPTRPLNVASAMKISPSSGPFRMIAGAAIAYGLTTGGAFAPEIGITPLGMRIVRPTKPGDDAAAKREALLKPKIVGEFLRDYDGAALPPEQIAKNVLLEKGVPPERINDVFALILEGAATVGFLKDINGKKYVDLASAPPQPDLGQPASGDQIQSSSLASSPMLAAGTRQASSTTVGAGIHVNIEIHIAADAASETIEEIFKNMRRYVLSGDGDTDVA